MVKSQNVFSFLSHLQNKIAATSILKLPELKQIRKVLKVSKMVTKMGSFDVQTVISCFLYEGKTKIKIFSET